MYEIVYKLAFFMMLVIFFSFMWFIKVELDYYKKFHWLDFINLDKNFLIKTWTISYQTMNVIYINTIPPECRWLWKKSIKCLAAIKKTQMWVYNKLAFFTWTNFYK